MCINYQTIVDALLMTAKVCLPSPREKQCTLRAFALQVLASLLDQGQIDGARLQSAQYEFEQFSALQRRQRFMLLQLDPGARAGEPRALEQVISSSAPAVHLHAAVAPAYQRA